MEMMMMMVERQLPRNRRIIRPTKAGGQHGLAQHAEDGGFDEDRLIADGVHGRARRQALLYPRQQRFDAVDDVERRGGAGLEDRHQHRARAVDADEIGLRRRALVHVGDVAQRR